MQVVKFFKPLTLILGPNGTGKTVSLMNLRLHPEKEVLNLDPGVKFT